ncbi:MAG: flavodoxin family protein [Promethearchaeota archaeon]|jgi:multimeric flavodoxin WrbA
MKVVGINGSPNPRGNTFQLIKMVFDEIKEENNEVHTEMIQLAGTTINSCLSCYKCFRNKDNKCVQKDDLNELYVKMIEADAIVLGTPVYFGDATGKMRCFIERSGFIALANNRPLKRKIGAIVIAKRRQGGIQALNTLNFFFYVSDMIIVGYAIGIGTYPGEVQKDTEGKSDMKLLGKNIIWLLEKLHS